ncbi:respiratory burst oxidase [Achlya hypogyna]|uniref:Respiratory burst oxidase n=1 Tax=Achlya hypogyna TaxID=1202772 RepID=A0A1V9ZFQ8_ACHHY|nr:respiratory burst oxidase [Achlya hypogyna]
MERLRAQRLATAGVTYLMRRSEFDAILHSSLMAVLDSPDVATATASGISEADLTTLRSALLPGPASIASNAAEIQAHVARLFPGESLGDLENGDPAAFKTSLLLTACAQSQLSDDAKMRFVFDILDVHRTGFITRDAINEFLTTTMAMHHVKLCGVSVTDVLDRVFAKTDTGVLTFGDFVGIFGELAAPLATEPTPSIVAPLARRFYDAWLDYAVAHHAEVQFLTLYFLLNVIIATIKISTIPWDPIAGQLARLAKAMAQIVLVNAAAVLLPMCRSLVTALRNIRWLWAVVPFDHTIAFHKIAAAALLGASVVHSVAWVFIVVYARSASDLDWQMSILNKDKTRLLRYGTYMDVAATLPVWTGLAMLACAAIAVPCTHHRIRRASFNIFWLSHCLFVPFTIFLLMHGLLAWMAPPQTQFWIGGPVLLYLVERRYRVSAVFGGSTRIIKAHVATDTVAVYMKKPRGFHGFQPGMYLFLKVPVLSRFEWHPFTISSCPEDDYLSVHIRRAGDWTNALHDHLKAVAATGAAYPAIAIDGPVGTPSQDYGNYPAVVLIGAGIGVTPFASILKHLVHVWEEHRCPDCGVVQLPDRIALRKIYFYWITREQENLCWFRETMQQLSTMDTDHRLEIQTYLTPLSRESVVAPLRLIQTFMQVEDGHDVLTGITSKEKNVTHFGRPDWYEEVPFD